MESLFDQSIEFKEDVFRNIPSLRKSQDLFDDINDDDENLSHLAIKAESYVKRNIPLGAIQRGFHYTTAIAYPFETDPFMASRYGDGKFGVWYGSLEFNTSIFETVYHMIKDESDIIDLDENQMIIRERAVYKVDVNAVLIDLRDKRNSHPLLVSNDYEFTQMIAQKLTQQGHPGLLAPSARCLGNNAVIFNIHVLGNPRLHCYLNYYYKPKTQQVTIERNLGEAILTIHRQELNIAYTH